ncbi:MAG: hypothetical protein CMM84_06005 [Rhodothermaceae bacterium]|nr:hypothetical protein [Rhodothermaceae bacterium]MBC13672.1 hypothetical protein [Rhodothermaceae bacterium]
MRHSASAFVLLTVFLLAACSPIADPLPGQAGPDPAAIEFEDEADYRAQREATAAGLDAAVGTASAAAVTSCRVAPTSEQACGGPTSFVVYSEDENAREVERLAARLVALDRAANAQFEWASTCMAYTPPPVALREGRCVADE